MLFLLGLEMKNFILSAFLFLLFAASATAEEQKEEVLFDFENSEQGGFGAPVMKFSAIDNYFALISGGRGAWVIDHNFVIGAGYYDILYTDLRAENADDIISRRPRLQLNLIGLELEYIFSPHKAVHFTAMTFFGAGRVSFSSDFAGNRDDNYNPDYGDDWFIAVEPSVNIELNIAEWMRLSLGAAYRFAVDAEYNAMGSSFDDAALSGPVGSITFKFGSF